MNLVVVHVLLLNVELLDDNEFLHLPVIQLLPIRHEAFNIVRVPAQVLKLLFDHAADLVRLGSWILPGSGTPYVAVSQYILGTGEIVVVADSPDDCLRLLPRLVQQGGVHGIPDIHRCTGGIEDQRSAVWRFRFCF